MTRRASSAPRVLISRPRSGPDRHAPDRASPGLTMCCSNTAIHTTGRRSRRLSCATRSAPRWPRRGHRSARSKTGSATPTQHRTRRTVRRSSNAPSARPRRSSPPATWSAADPPTKPTGASATYPAQCRSADGVVTRRAWRSREPERSECLDRAGRRRHPRRFLSSVRSGHASATSSTRRGSGRHFPLLATHNLYRTKRLHESPNRAA